MGNRWGNSGKSGRLYFWGSKIPADGDCSHKIKRRLLLGRKVMTNLDSILKSRDITLPTKVRLVKAMVFPLVMYGYESWTVKKAERRSRCFWTVVLEKTLESPLDYKEIQPVHSKGDQSWVFFGRTDAKAESPVVWPPHAKSWLIGKTLRLGGIGGRRRKGQQRMKWVDDITNSMNMSLSELRELVMDMEAWRAAIHGSQIWIWLSDWTELNYVVFQYLILNFMCKNLENQILDSSRYLHRSRFPYIDMYRKLFFLWTWSLNDRWTHYETQQPSISMAT